MASKRDWVDYANLATNVVQTTQLDGINSKMREMAELELQKEHRVQQEAAVARFEDIFRDAVFSYAEMLRDIDEIASQNPVAAYIRANHLKRLYEGIPTFKASKFRKYEDKERLATVLRTCDRLIRESAQRLTPNEQEASIRCITYIFDREELTKLISVQEQAEQLEQDRIALPEKQAAKQRELQKAKVAQQQNVKPFWMPILVVVMVVFGICGVGGLIVFIVGFFKLIKTDDSSLLGTGAVLFFPSAGIFIWLAHLLETNQYKLKEAELAKQVVSIEAEIKAMNADIVSREAKIRGHQLLYNKFGEAKADDHRRMLRDRDTHQRLMLGDFAGKYADADYKAKAVEFCICPFCRERVEHRIMLGFSWCCNCKKQWKSGDGNEAQGNLDSSREVVRPTSNLDEESGIDEEIIQQSIEVLRSEQRISVSLLERRLRLGCCRAARILDELEKRKIIGPCRGTEPREILIDIGGDGGVSSV